MPAYNAWGVNCQNFASILSNSICQLSQDIFPQKDWYDLLLQHLVGKGTPALLPISAVFWRFLRTNIWIRLIFGLIYSNGVLRHTLLRKHIEKTAFLNPIFLEKMVWERVWQRR